jgi:acyl transferase domain-containing protein
LEDDQMDSVIDNPNAIAVIGMSARFPGAPTLDQFWGNLIDGVESISFFSEEELRAAGVPNELIREPHYVPAASLLDGVEQFDARFFGFTPREAELTDPQHRLFLEVAWEAMESAGYGGENPNLAVGVFAGAGPTACSYLGSDTHLSPKLLGPAGSREHIGNDKDYLTTRVSYRLNLRGPSVCVQTACSTSLVAVHLACQSLLMGESDMALAGGVTVRVPQRKGYTARDNAICSPDGHCRAFDASAEGTVFGSGVGVVVLKRLARAVEDGDSIRAVIRATAVNNDGGDKISYWASSVDGQIAALSEAMAVAEVEPSSIGFVEAHGTGTTMGDPIEVMALTQVFRAGTERSGYCALGSVKTNVGHLDSAAGIVSFIKTILTLERKTIPPTLHFKTPNPRIKFEATPFFVNTEAIAWEEEGGPRRAIVNALGIGGTNACAVLEEPPPVVVDNKVAVQPVCVMPLSAKNAKALDQLVSRYQEYLERSDRADLFDICYTAAAGRRHFDHRVACVVNSYEELKGQLAAFANGEQTVWPISGKAARGGPPKFALLLSGNVSRPLVGDLAQLRQLPALADAWDRCEGAIRRRTGMALPDHLSGRKTGAADVSSLEQVKPRLLSFAMDYGFAQQWIASTGTPAMITGCGDGEVTAACVAGQISLEDAVAMLANDECHWGTGPQRPELGKARCPTWSVSSQIGLERAWQAKRSPEELSRWPADCSAELKKALPNLAAVVRIDTIARPLADADHGAELPVIHATSDRQCPWQRVMSMLAGMYALGVAVDWDSAFVGPKRRVSLPTYPFQRKPFWMEPVALGIDHLPVPAAGKSNRPRRVLVADDPETLVLECRIQSLALADVEAGCQLLMAEVGESVGGQKAMDPNQWEFQLPDSGETAGPWILQMIARPAAEGALTATVFCRSDDQDVPVAWNTLATTRLTPIT